MLGKKVLPPHRQRTLKKLLTNPDGLDYLTADDGVLYPPIRIHGRVYTNVDPQSRERAQKRWDALRDVVIRTPELTRIAQKLQESVRILKMHPHERSDPDVAHLYSWLMSQENLSPLFQTMPEKIGKNICREMEFLHLHPNEIIVHQGDIGETCFIVISGLVAIHVRSPEEQEEFVRSNGRRDFPADPSTSQHEARQLLASRPSISSPRRVSAFIPPTPKAPVPPEGLVRMGPRVTVLKAGATFGEICLIEPDSKRTATAIVDVACTSAYLIVLSATSYAKMTRSQRVEGSISDHIAFLHQMILFKSWSKMQLMRLASSLRYVVFAPQQYIQRKNADVEYMYMLLGGEAKEVSGLTFQEDVVTGAGNKTAEHRVTAELTHLTKFDITGEGLVLGKKKKLFGLYFLGASASHRHVQTSTKILLQLFDARQRWREARVQQALAYPEYMVQITAKMMRLSGNMCMQCGRRTHVAGDVLCLHESAARHDHTEKANNNNDDAEAPRANERARHPYVATGSCD
ncbi:hypothetical protein ACHHYP_08259 [Achlya hypogyna]|uniref:Cyclic nucleotide-binding domain-containing protein n=1 Tax=Achlya hypogyna TaxID=1202772 RepID=A0A1V9ZLN0_ACHHY|nr:hypothetical protein ACHHYP_08259 [Achlya hypogyna]